ncbi:alginate export family protein [Sphingomonas psychrotolerans]|uniref:Alginate export family protein n=1 Tax=Sphingomonas psychrotolerans TaxID=1327635 RepID=A0ABU3N6H0_9SPHN|nr:alginate export family protein [Sphingomonas psychrotolerans]MDT8760124.1 alginate export family protein [Sphingomonas psychrotolerans]
MLRPSARFAFGASLLALTTAPAAAQTLTPISTAPEVRNDELLVVASYKGSGGAPSDVAKKQEVPPAQPATPPSEATPERAPANPATRAYPRQADGHGVKLGGYNLSRWAEDWRLMRDPKKRDDFLDRLKYLPLDSKGDIYLTLSGEIRIRADYYSNPGMVDSEYRVEDKLRLVGGADLHVGPLRFYGELAHGGLAGHNYGAPSAKFRDDLFAQQFFGEIGGTVGGVTLGARYGRQEFTDGSSTLVQQKDNNTIRTVEQGLRAWAQLSAVRVDLFDFEHVRLGLDGLSDDIPDPQTRFSGVTAGVVLRDDKTHKLFLDPFVWRERNDKQRWGSVTAREIRHYYGARFWGSYDDLTLDWTVARQTGDFAGRSIDAWSAAVAQTYALGKKGWAPRIGVHFDYGSGGGSFGTGTIHTARPVTAGSVLYSYQGALMATNLFQASPNFTVSPIKTIDVTLEYQRSWRPDESDAVYRGAGTAYARTQLIAGNHIGDALHLQASWKITPRLSLTARWEYFAAGEVLEAAKVSDSHYFGSWLNFRF